MTAKGEAAFRTIGEVSAALGVPQHVLRYWETRFPALRPLQRAGNRRYYRPEDVALVRAIDGWLNRDGYTVKGVQQLLATGAHRAVAAASPGERVEPVASDRPPAAGLSGDAGASGNFTTGGAADGVPAAMLAELRAIRAELAAALAQS